MQPSSSHTYLSLSSNTPPNPLPLPPLSKHIYTHLTFTLFTHHISHLPPTSLLAHFLLSTYLTPTSTLLHSPHPSHHPLLISLSLLPLLTYLHLQPNTLLLFLTTPCPLAPASLLLAHLPSVHPHPPSLLTCILPTLLLSIFSSPFSILPLYTQLHTTLLAPTHL